MRSEKKYIDPLRFYHPSSVCIYYLMYLVVLILLPHPVLLCISFIFLLTNTALKTGILSALKKFVFSIPVILIITLINPLVNHRGPTTLFYAGSLRITLESALYGASVGLLLVVAIALFFELSEDLSSDRVMTVLAGRFPSLSLVLSMLLRLVPIASYDARSLYMLHGAGRKPLSALISMTMEDGIIRSISMTDRGYNSSVNPYKKRTSFYKRPLKTKDIILIFVSVVFLALGIIFKLTSHVYFRFFPSLLIKTPPLEVVLIWCLFVSFPVFASVHHSR